MQGRNKVLVLWIACLLLVGCSGGTPQNNNVGGGSGTVGSVDLAESVAISDADLDTRGLVDHWTSNPVPRIDQAWFLLDNMYITRPGKNGKYFLEKIDGDTGRLAWSFTVEGRLEIRPSAFRYPKEMAGNSDELFIVQNIDGAGEYIICIDDKFGAENYRIPCGFPVSTPVTAGPNNLYVGSWNSRIYCIGKATRLEEWSYITDAPITAAPELGGLNVYVGSEDHMMYSLSRAGGYVHDKSWQRLTQGAIVSQPLFYHDRIYFGSHDYKVYCLEEYQGLKRWSMPAGSKVSKRLFPFSDWIFAVSDADSDGTKRFESNLFALDQGDGTSKWMREKFQQVLAADNFHCYAQSNDDKIHAIRLENGVSAWELDVDEFDFVLGQDAHKGAAREKWGRMYLATKNGVVQCIRPRK